jgi:hypothetical protein
MMRFSIRELLTFTLATGLFLAWFYDRAQLKAAIDTARSAEIRSEYLEREIDGIDKQLGERGLRIAWICTHGGLSARVAELPADELDTIQNSN